MPRESSGIAIWAVVVDRVEEAAHWRASDFGAATGAAATVLRFGHSPVAADDVGEFTRCDMVVLAPLLISMHVELIEPIRFASENFLILGLGACIRKAVGLCVRRGRLHRR